MADRPTAAMKAKAERRTPAQVKFLLALLKDLEDGYKEREFDGSVSRTTKVLFWAGLLNRDRKRTLIGRNEYLTRITVSLTKAGIKEARRLQETNNDQRTED